MMMTVKKAIAMSITTTMTMKMSITITMAMTNLVPRVSHLPALSRSGKAKR